MKSVLQIGIATAGAIAFNTLGASVALAQSGKAAPAYVVLEFKVKDPDGFKDYAQRAPATVTQYGGKFLVRPGKVVGLAGEAPKGPFAVLVFDNAEQAQKWAGSPEYSALKPLRDKSAEARLFIVEGAAP